MTTPPSDSPACPPALQRPPSGRAVLQVFVPFLAPRGVPTALADDARFDALADALLAACDAHGVRLVLARPLGLTPAPLRGGVEVDPDRARALVLVGELDAAVAPALDAVLRATVRDAALTGAWVSVAPAEAIVVPHRPDPR